MAAPGPTTVGDRYELLRKLGAGGMAEVWLAADRRLNDKHVAVKRLHGFRAGAPSATIDLDRARREAFAASRVNHPNLIAVTDFVAEHGEPFIVMEYVEGPTLDQLCADGPLPLERAAHLISQVAGALGEAHDAHIVHRDIKPANIIITSRGDAKLADFGIAKSPDDPRYTATGMFTGTMRYLAPEVIDGAQAGPASDIWALGATLFEVLEGRPAFDAPTNMGLLAAIALTPVPPVTRAPRAAALVARMLSRDANKRPDAAEVAAELRRLAMPAEASMPWIQAEVAPTDATVVAAAVTAPPAAPRRVPPRRPQTRPKRRSRAYVLVAVPAVLAAAGGLAVFVNHSSQQPLADRQQPTVVRSSGIGGGQPAPTQRLSEVAPSTSPLVGGGAPQPSGGVTTTLTVRFHGLVVRKAADLRRAPVIVSRASTDPPALEVTDVVQGSGAKATPNSDVTLRYVGLVYRTGVVFDSSWTQASPDASVALPRLLPGLVRGVAGHANISPMRVGGRRIVIIPAVLAYGAHATETIPANAALAFVVDLRKVG